MPHSPGSGIFELLPVTEAVKGLILSLSQIHESPRELLIRANHLISEHLDSRSFITMTYAVIDPAAGVMTYARAGHTPLLHLPASGGPDGRARILAPDGMVLGLRIDDGERAEVKLKAISRPFSCHDTPEGMPSGNCGARSSLPERTSIR